MFKPNQHAIKGLAIVLILLLTCLNVHSQEAEATSQSTNTAVHLNTGVSGLGVQGAVGILHKTKSGYWGGARFNYFGPRLVGDYLESYDLIFGKMKDRRHVKTYYWYGLGLANRYSQDAVNNSQLPCLFGCPETYTRDATVGIPVGIGAILSTPVIGFDANLSANINFKMPSIGASVGIIIGDLR